MSKHSKEKGKKTQNNGYQSRTNRVSRRVLLLIISQVQIEVVQTKQQAAVALSNFATFLFCFSAVFPYLLLKEALIMAGILS